MTNPNRYDLLGYLAGALEPAEQHAIEEALRHDPALNDELRRARRRLDVLTDVAGDYQPPPGLADRTLQFIGQSEQCGADDDPQLGAKSPKKPRPSKPHTELAGQIGP